MNARRLAHVGLGGNIGDVAGNFEGAIAEISALPGTRLVARSRLYRTPAWGVREQADFLNAAIAIETGLDPWALMEALLAIESRFGRTRAADGSDRWGPRSLDLDLLLFGDAVVDAPGLRVPHPRLHERAFALLPLAEIAAGVAIPGIGTVGEALAALDADGIEALT